MIEFPLVECGEKCPYIKDCGETIYDTISLDTEWCKKAQVALDRLTVSNYLVSQCGDPNEADTKREHLKSHLDCVWCHGQTLSDIAENILEGSKWKPANT